MFVESLFRWEYGAALGALYGSFMGSYKMLGHSRSPLELGFGALEVTIGVYPEKRASIAHMGRISNRTSLARLP